METETPLLRGKGVLSYFDDVGEDPRWGDINDTVGLFAEGTGAQGPRIHNIKAVFVAVIWSVGVSEKENVRADCFSAGYSAEVGVFDSEDVSVGKEDALSAEGYLIEIGSGGEKVAVTANTAQINLRVYGEQVIGISQSVTEVNKKSGIVEMF